MEAAGNEASLGDEVFSTLSLFWSSTKSYCENTTKPATSFPKFLHLLGRKSRHSTSRGQPAHGGKHGVSAAPGVAQGREGTDGQVLGQSQATGIPLERKQT